MLGALKAIYIAMFIAMLGGALYVHHRHICALPKHLNVCISFLREAPMYTFKKYASDPYQTVKYRRCDFLGLRICASGRGIKLCPDFRKQQNVLFIIDILTRTRSQFSTSLHTCNLHIVPVVNAFRPQSCSPSRILMTTAYKLPARIKI